MSDIVERLRQKERDYYQRDTGGAYGMGPVLRDAADEIERLRGLLGEAADDIEHWGGYASEYFKDKWHLEDDIKKYRDAALAGAAVQPSALPERCSVCGGAHDVGNPCRATSPTDGAP